MTAQIDITSVRPKGWRAIAIAATTGLHRVYLLSRVLWTVLALVAFEIASAAEAGDSNVSSAIDGLERALDSALQARDREKLDALLATPFTWVHTAGMVESRESWLDQAAKGRAFIRQRAQVEEIETSLAAFPNDSAIRTARLRFRSPDNTLETWMIQTRIYVRQSGAWKLAGGQGTRMYEGPPIRAELYSRYAARYRLTDGRELTIDWDGTSLFARFPNGNRYQIFLKSPTEEATLGSSKLRFEVDASGTPTTAISMSGDVEIWRARRQ